MKNTQLLLLIADAGGQFLNPPICGHQTIPGNGLADQVLGRQPAFRAAIRADLHEASL